MGALGAVISVSASVVSVTAVLAAEFPTELTALTWKVYSVSASNPVIVCEVVVESVSVHVPPAVEPVVKRYWYSVIAVPPVSVGAAHERSTLVWSGVTVRLVGAPGTVVRVVSVTAVLASELPTELTARTWNGVFRPFIQTCLCVRGCRLT